jgi:hypothetical protein
MIILQNILYISPTAVLWIRIHVPYGSTSYPHQSDKLDPDSHQCDQLDPDPDSDLHQFADYKPNLWNMSPFKHFSKVLSIYLEARIQIRINVMRICNNAHNLVR